eukprot:jgi/Astpho2/3931/Aster-x1187
MTESGSGCQAQWGEKLKVVGSCPALGGWDVAAAPDLHWTDGHVWTQAVEVPAGAKIEYKVVHLHHSGVNWEPTPNRVLVAGFDQEPAEPACFGLDINCQWSHPDATSVSLLTSDPCELEQVEGTWDLTASGLPQDLTEELAEVNAAAFLGANDTHSEAAQQRQQVPEQAEISEPAEVEQPLETAPEPVRANLATDESAQLLAPEDFKAASMYAAEAAAAVAAPASVTDQAASATATDSLAAIGPAEAGQLKAQDTEAAELAEFAVNGTTKSPLQKVGEAASYAAMAVGAGVLLSAMAIDVTDAALASAVVAAGAAVLPGSGKGREKKALRSEKAPMIEALSMGLDAVQNVSGAIKRAQTEGVGGKRTESSSEEEPAEEESQKRLGEELAVASSMEPAEAAAAAEAQAQPELALKSSIAQAELEQARRWGETYESQDEDDTPHVASPAHSINGSTSGLQ